ncbi:MAG TPA: YncE family protein [Bacteroidales bacterium]|nr:YncE family protein [Bacteroidales bacterium]HPT09549.1 YncE family protein [Bacteroidales bacterium]
MSLVTHLSRFLILLSCIFLISCSKDPIREITVDPYDTTTKPAEYGKGVFVINEGNYNWGNASVTFVDYTTGIATQNIFTKENGRNLGDVAQSMKIINGKGYIVVNNSYIIEIVDIQTFKSIQTIKGFPSPRHIGVINSKKAYVSNLKKGISILNLVTNEITGTILIEGWTENLVLCDKFMFVTCIGEYREPSSKRHQWIAVLDTESDQVVDTLPCGKEPIGMVMDKNNKIWVLCSGGYDFYERPSLMRINPSNRAIEEVIPFQASQRVPGKLTINTAGDTLYFLNGGIFRMPIQSETIPANPWIPSNGRLLYGLSVHPVNRTVFVSDALDYVQNGVVYQYDPNGVLIRQFTVGRIPGSFCFTPLTQ